MRILVVEDLYSLAKEVKRGFELNDIACDVAATAADTELMISAVAYPLVVLDLGLPDEDGLGLLVRLRASGVTAPIIILTARGDLESRIKGLSAGADDYVVKPFHFEELLARVRAFLRRSGGYQDPVICVGPLKLDVATREFSADNCRIGVSAREGDILELLMRRPNKVVPKRLIEDQLFGIGDSLGSNAIEVYVHRIRRRLKENDLPLCVQTVRGVGYILQTC